MSPDGRWLVFRRDSTPLVGAFHRLALGPGLVAVGEPVQLTTTLSAGKATWLPDSREILFSSRGALWRLDALRGGEPVRLPYVGEDGLAPVVAQTSDGSQRLVYVRSFADSNIWRVSTSAPGLPATSPPAAVVASTRMDAMTNLSPDGQRLAFMSNRSGEQEIWAADMNGDNAVQVTSLAPNPGIPRWSPDGRFIAYIGDPRNRPDVLVAAVGGGTPQIMTTTVANGGYPSFSRDGRWIYFCLIQDEQTSIWKMPATGGEPVRVTSTRGTLAIESRDGRHLFYVEASDRPSALWRLPLAGGTAEKLLDGVFLANFDVVEGGIYYIDRVAGGTGATERPGGTTRLLYFDFSTRQSTTIASDLGTVGFGLSASRDGRTIFFSRVDTAVDELMAVENFR